MSARSVPCSGTAPSRPGGSAEAFAGLPDVAADDADGLDETASLAKTRAGMTYTLAWNLACRNDEDYRWMTPEERYTSVPGVD